jgi:general stress protein YciG
MPGTVNGGRKAAATNKHVTALISTVRLARLGGKISRGGGFMMNRDLAVEAGRRGGKASRRTKAEIDQAQS